VALENCAIACGGRALALRPQTVRRDLFEADLWLDRCTIASERAFVELGTVGRRQGGPDRPWLVSSRHCAFIDSFARDLRLSPVLLADPEAMARGVLFWHRSATPTTSPASRRPIRPSSRSAAAPTSAASGSNSGAAATSST
jgi:serine/threonine-protein kinase